MAVMNYMHVPGTVPSSQYRIVVTESRFHALGKTNAGRLLHITFTLRFEGRKVRPISARDMHRKERRVYEESAQGNS
jgi:uncharacterized DUF497 family protein